MPGRAGGRGRGRRTGRGRRRQGHLAGYFALPILYGDRLVGKLDATADRTAGVLRVDAIRQDVPFDRTMAAAVQDEIRDLAHWLDLELRLPGTA